MPRRLLGVFMLLLVSVSLVQAQGEAVLLTVGSDTVCRDEFEYYFSKSVEKRADVFMETYGRFKQKVLYARELGLDTLQGIRLLAERYKVLADKSPSSDKRRALQESDKEWIRLKHITYPLKQSADKRMQQKGKMYLDSIYKALKEGADIHVEELPWTQTRHLLKDWQNQLENLNKDEFSKPFFSPQGIHVIAWKEKKYGKPLAMKEKTSDEVYRMKELEEGVLVAVLDAHWEKTLDCTESDLENYFKTHRTDYGGGTPHFKGAVIHCRNKKDAKKIKSYLKKLPESLWKEAVERMPEESSLHSKIEAGMFTIGMDPYVDKLVFKCGDYEALPDYPYTFVLGKKLKKGPTSYRDVMPRIKIDCLESMKKAEMEAIMKKYPIEINKEVLKTVNRAEN